MKYAHGIIGLLIGTALGGSVVAATLDKQPGGSAPDADQVKEIVRQVIHDEPQLLVDSLQSYQRTQQQAAMDKASTALKDSATREGIFNDAGLPFAGAKDGTHVIAEFFDYDCPVCKMQFKMFTDMLKQDPKLKIVFHEYPIFGPTSEENSKIGLAVNHLYPEKYFEFHGKMMGGKGHEQNVERTYGFVKELGMDAAKVKEYAKSDDVAKQLEKSRALGEKLNIEGTPTLVVGNEVIPHAASADDLHGKFAD